MQLIQELSSGFSTAPNGTAQVYARGTSTPVIYYNDAEGLSPVTAGTPVVLDSQGAAEVYVNQVVGLLVLNTGGATVSDTTVMDASPLTEVRSNSFTGVDYVSGAAAAGNPTTVQAVLDKVFASFGTVDWNVLVGGSSITLQAALASATGLYFNVRGYGAKGDGTTDDTAAITAAITAAAVAGGTVYFPPAELSGFYLTTSVLSLQGNVNFLGSGTESAVLKVNSGTATCINTTVAPSGTNTHQFISNMTIEPSVSNNGAAISVGTTMPLLVENCRIGGSLSNPSTRVLAATTAGADLTINDCVCVVANDQDFYSTTSVVKAEFTRCTFIGEAVSRTSSLVDPDGTVAFNDCTFDGSAATSGTHTLVDLTDATLTNAKISDCAFLGGNGATVTAITTMQFNAGINIQERGSTFDSFIDTRFVLDIDLADYPATSANGMLGTREGAYLGITHVPPAFLTLDTEQYGNHFVEMTGAGTTQLVNSTQTGGAGLYVAGVLGSRLSITLRNAGSAIVTVSFSATQFVITTPGTVAIGGTVTYTFEYQYNSASAPRWVSTGISA